VCGVALRQMESEKDLMAAELEESRQVQEESFQAHASAGAQRWSA